ncbi:hypothetical protein [Microbacterium atlanticum]|jgi:hypothetical protein|uniref:hypothetical protein n=1 Tax=Microbacterium atlanticum TaxID=2782168 RepID=UPI001887ADFD|nr:hypothetical protein [Microbacterium atlanticum]
MEPQRENPDAASSTSSKERLSPLSEQDSLRKDMSYSPGSETETQRKQEDELPDSLDPDIDADAVNVVPGTGGPDDVGDVEVDPDELNLPGRAADA